MTEGVSDKGAGIEDAPVNKFTPEAPYADEGNYQNHLLEQYKLYVEMADRISARRQTANSFFLSVNTALIGLFAYLRLNESLDFKRDAIWIAMVSIASILVNYAWYRLVRSYRDINAGKFTIINKIEELLPLSPYKSEWDVLGKGERADLYLPFTSI